ncbi:MAG TPA: FRG domain-containing protein [Thermoanaerobaculia bacterium]|jgi:hypothetical protein|nr:FRG domain-containing protein [Thermoanaerobaculia bacterium]
MEQLATPASHIEEIHFTSAIDFLKYLHLTGDHWGTSPACTWMFRGQGDARWPLLPRAWREPFDSLLQRLAAPSEAFLRGDARRVAALARYNGRAATAESCDDETFVQNIATLLVRTAGELFAIDEFVRLSDNVGLRIPSARASVYNDFMDRLSRIHLDAVLHGDLDWLLPAFDDTFGLAQHHGVPTRLLDFTLRPMVAAFFAAQNAAGETIAVWAVDRLSLMASRVAVLTCRRYDNTFLHAQDGVFLYDSEAPYDFLRSGTWPSLEAVLAAEQTERAIRKLTLPSSESGPLLRLLWRERVSAAHLMPTYDNVVKSVPFYWRYLDDHLSST